MNRRRWMLLALVLVPMIAVGVASGREFLKPPRDHRAGGYTCPITGAELPCPKCCPLKKGK